MRVIVLIKGDKATEAGAMPSEKLLHAMLGFNEQLVAAGIIKNAAGLFPSSRATRVTLDTADSGKEPVVKKGPYENPDVWFSGFWLWTVESMDDAIAWVKKAPVDRSTTFEIRQLNEMEDYEHALTEEGKKRGEELLLHLDN